jgi:hypothetical protein
MTEFLQRWACKEPLIGTVSDQSAAKRPLVHSVRDSDKAVVNFAKPDTGKAIQEIAVFLAEAYQRFARVPIVPLNPANNLNRDALALSADQSVHECD